MRNAEAAKRCREKKKKEEMARLQELECKIVEMKGQIDSLKFQNDCAVSEKEKLQSKSNFLNDLVSKLKNELHRQKEYIIKLEANMMAMKMSGRIAPITAFNSYIRGAINPCCSDTAGPQIQSHTSQHHPQSRTMVPLPDISELDELNVITGMELG